MKIAIVGTGAMGSVYAGLFASSGHDVWAVDNWREHIDAIIRNGLRVEGASGDRRVAMNATTTVNDVGLCDLVVIATKSYDVVEAAKQTQSLLGENTLVLTIQNGLGSPEKVAKILGDHRVAIGVVGGFGASISEPGHVHHNGMELVRLGELKGGVTPRIEEVAKVWRESGFAVKAFDDPHQLIWEKLICNVCYSGSTSVTGKTIGQVIDDPDAWRIASGCALEAFEVARATGIHLDFHDPIQYVREFGSKIPNAKPSMLLDRLARRRSEIDAINGAIPRAASEVGLKAPYNEVISSLVRTAERNYGNKNSL